MNKNRLEHRRNIGLLIVGIGLGFLAGPYGLGWWLPWAYNSVWVKGGGVQQEINAFDQATDRQRDRLKQSGVTHDAIDELDYHSMQRRKPLATRLQQVQAQHLSRLRHYTLAVMIAIGMVIVLESLAGSFPRSRRLRRTLKRLTAARHGLLAVAVVIIVARPRVLPGVHPTFLILILVIALAAAWVPAGSSCRVSRQ